MDRIRRFLGLFATIAFAMFITTAHAACPECIIDPGSGVESCELKEETNGCKWRVKCENPNEYAEVYNILSNYEDAGWSSVVKAGSDACHNDNVTSADCHPKCSAVRYFKFQNSSSCEPYIKAGPLATMEDSDPPFFTYEFYDYKNPTCSADTSEQCDQLSVGHMDGGQRKYISKWTGYCDGQNIEIPTTPNYEAYVLPNLVNNYSSYIADVTSNTSPETACVLTAQCSPVVRYVRLLETPNTSVGWADYYLWNLAGVGWAETSAGGSCESDTCNFVSMTTPAPRAGDKITLSNGVTRNFLGWGENDGDIILAAGKTMETNLYMVRGNLIQYYYAIYDGNSITYQFKGSISGGKTYTLGTISCTENSTCIAPTLADFTLSDDVATALKHYTLGSNWINNSASSYVCGTSSVNLTPGVTNMSPTKYISDWDNACVVTGTLVPNVYSIKLSNNDGTDAATTIYEKYGVGFSATNYGTAITKVTIPTRTGHTFRGYYDAATDGALIIPADGTLPAATTFPAATTLYAQWDANSYECAAGTYLPAGAAECAICNPYCGTGNTSENCISDTAAYDSFNKYCPGGTFAFNPDAAQGQTDCSTLGAAVDAELGGWYASKAPWDSPATCGYAAPYKDKIPDNCASEVRPWTYYDAENNKWPTVGYHVTANAGAYVVNQGSMNASCALCVGGYTAQGNTDTACSPCPPVTDEKWSYCPNTGWATVQQCCESKVTDGCATGATLRYATNETTWGAEQTDTTIAVTANENYYVFNNACYQCGTIPPSSNIQGLESVFPMYNKSDGGNVTLIGSADSQTDTCYYDNPAGKYYNGAAYGLVDCVTGSYCVAGKVYFNKQSGSKILYNCATETNDMYIMSDAASDAKDDCKIQSIPSGKRIANAGAGLSDCPAGSYCVSSNTAVYYGTDGGKNAPVVSDNVKPCPIGTYSASGAGTCTPCQNGKTTSATGSTSCDINCANYDANFIWETAVWNAATGTVSNLCQVSGCKATNACTFDSAAVASCTSVLNGDKTACQFVATCQTGYNTPTVTTSGATATATCAPNTFQVKYANTNTEITQAVPQTNTCKYDAQCLVAPAMSNTAKFSFRGWSYNGMLYQPSYDLKNIVTSGEITLTAVWSQNNYEITLNHSSGTGSVDKLYEVYGTGWKLDLASDDTVTKIAVPTRDGYNFNGYWNDAGTTRHIAADGTLPAATTFAAKTTLYAQWTPKSYNITYNLNQGTNNSANPSTYNITQSVTLAMPTRDKHVFVGWYDNADLTGTAVTGIPVGTTGDKAFWAKWTACGECSASNGVSCTVTVTNNTCNYVASCLDGYWNLKNGTSVNATCDACGGNNYYCRGGVRTEVTSGYYSTGGTPTTRTGQSQCTGTTYCVDGEQKDCPTGYIHNTDAGKTSDTQCTILVAGGSYIKTPGESTPSGTCELGFAKAQHVVNYGATSSCDKCGGGTILNLSSEAAKYADETGLAACKSCPTATQHQDKVYSYYTWNANGLFVSANDCYARFTPKGGTVDTAHGTINDFVCSYKNGDYGIGGGDCRGWPTKCDAGYYAVANQHLGTYSGVYEKSCSAVGDGNYSPVDDTKLYNCPASGKTGITTAGAVTDCYQTCPAGWDEIYDGDVAEFQDLQIGTTQPVNAHENWAGSAESGAYPACTYTIDCIEDWTAVGDNTTNPTCKYAPGTCQPGWFCPDGQDPQQCPTDPDGGTPTSPSGATAKTDCYVTYDPWNRFEKGVASAKCNFDLGSGNYASCSIIKVSSCDDGYYYPTLGPIACSPVTSGSYSPKPDTAQTPCPAAPDGSQVYSAALSYLVTQCYKACPLTKADIPHSATVSAAKNTVNAISAAAGYEPCSYTITCAPGYTPSGNGGENPTCQPNVYTVVLNKNGGAGSVAESIKCTYDSQVCQIPSYSALSRQGYNTSAAKWCTNADGTGTCYTANANTTQNISVDGTSVTLYAVWTPNVYAVNLDDQGATSAAQPRTVYLKYATGWYSDRAATNPLVKLTTVPGFDGLFNFIGYYLSTDTASTQLVDSNGNLLTDSKALTALWTDNATIYAQWSNGVVPCAAGTYYTGTGTTCTQCTAGNYCPGGASYGTNNGSVGGLNQCPESANGATSPAGASSQSDCYNTVAYTATYGAGTQVCYYNPSKQSYSQKCKDQRITSCAAGYWRANDSDTDCAPVGRGNYSGTDEMTRHACPNGGTTVANNTTAKSIQECYKENLSYTSITSHGTGTQSCFYTSGTGDSAVYARECFDKVITACSGGYYLNQSASDYDASNPDCTAVGVSYYSEKNDTQRHACPGGGKTAEDIKTADSPTACFREGELYPTEEDKKLQEFHGSGYRTCYYYGTVNGTAVYSANCGQPTLTKCDAGYYYDSEQKKTDCIPVTNGWWSGTDDTNRTQCPQNGKTGTSTAASATECYLTGLAYTATHGAGTQTCSYDASAKTYNATCRDKYIASCDAGYWRETDTATDCVAVTDGWWSATSDITRTRCAQNGKTGTATASAATECYLTGLVYTATHGAGTQTCSYDTSAQTYNATCRDKHIASCDAGYWRETNNATDCVAVTDGWWSTTSDITRTRCAQNGKTGTATATAATACYLTGLAYTATHGTGTQTCSYDASAKTYSATCRDKYIASCDAGYWRETDNATDCVAVTDGWWSGSNDITRTRCAQNGKTGTTTASAATACYLMCPAGKDVIYTGTVAGLTNTVVGRTEYDAAQVYWDSAKSAYNTCLYSATCTVDGFRPINDHNTLDGATPPTCFYSPDVCPVNHYCPTGDQPQECPDGGTSDQGTAITDCYKKTPNATDTTRPVAFENGVADIKCFYNATSKLYNTLCTAERVHQCIGGYWHKGNTDLLCRGADDMYFSPESSTSQFECAPGVSRSDTPRDSHTNCVKTCVLGNVPNMSRIVSQTTEVNGKSTVEAGYDACAYTIECNAGYSPANNGTETPTCQSKDYTITLYMNDGTDTVVGTVQCSYADAACALPTNTELKRTGYNASLNKWCVATNGGTCYSGGNTVPGSISANGDDIALYVAWTPNVYTVQLDDQGATSAAQPRTVYLKYATGWYSDKSATTPITELKQNPDYSGLFNFTGYYIDAEESTVQLIDSAGNFIDSVAAYTSISRDTTIYAHWSNGIVTCATGTYYTGSGTECTKCTAGNYCLGGSYGTNNGNVGGLTSCPDSAAGATSPAGAKAKGECYKTVSYAAPHGDGTQVCNYGTNAYDAACKDWKIEQCDMGYWFTTDSQYFPSTYSPSTGLDCVPVGTGFYSDDTAMTRKTCPTYTDAAGKASTGTTVGTTSTSKTDCYANNLGTYVNTNVQSGTQSCYYGDASYNQRCFNEVITVCTGGNWVSDKQETDASGRPICVAVGNGFYGPIKNSANGLMTARASCPTYVNVSGATVQGSTENAATATISLCYSQGAPYTAAHATGSQSCKWDIANNAYSMGCSISIATCAAGYYDNASDAEYNPSAPDCVTVKDGYFSPDASMERTPCKQGGKTGTDTATAESACYLTCPAGWPVIYNGGVIPTQQVGYTTPVSSTVKWNTTNAAYDICLYRAVCETAEFTPINDGNTQDSATPPTCRYEPDECPADYYCPSKGDIRTCPTLSDMSNVVAGPTSATNSDSAEDCYVVYNPWPSFTYGTARAKCKFDAATSGYTNCEIEQVLSCDAGYYYESGNGCTPVKNGFYSPIGNTNQTECPAGWNGSAHSADNPADNWDDCWRECSLTVEHASSVEPTDVRVMGASASTYHSCSFRVTCDTGYSVVGNLGANPKCAPNTYAINLNKNGATGTLPTSMECTYDSGTCTLPSYQSALTRTGYNATTHKWCTSADGTGTCYAAGENTAKNISTGDPITLYATWTPNVYTVTLNDMGANTHVSPTTVYLKYATGWYSDATTTKPITGLTTVPTKTAYVFNGFVTVASVPVVDKAGRFVTTTVVDPSEIKAVWTSGQMACAAGKYYGGTGATCLDCVANNYCPGGTYTTDGGVDGQFKCPSNGKSAASATAKTECYKTGLPYVIERGTAERMCYYSDEYDYNGYASTETVRCRHERLVSCDAGYSQVGQKCQSCPANSVCPSGRPLSCGEYTNTSDYIYSDAGQSDGSYCYRTCELATNAYEMLGRDYYGTNIADTCAIKSCQTGFYLIGDKCVVCPENHICVDNGEPQTCSSLTGGKYPLSDENSRNITDCYRDCSLEPGNVETGETVPIARYVNYPNQCVFACRTELGNLGSMVNGECVEKICAPSQEMISGQCTPCNREHAVSYKPVGNCEVETCAPGYHPDGDHCTDNIKGCTAPNAARAEQTWDEKRGIYSVCQIKECFAGYHLESNVCEPNIQPCSVDNGVGEREWNSVTNAWGECVVTVCDPGYTTDIVEMISNDDDVQCGRCRNAYGVGGEIAVDKYTNGCEIASCKYQGELYDLQNNECVPICEVKGYSDETGTRKWNPATKKCEITCTPGYMMW